MIKYSYCKINLDNNRTGYISLAIDRPGKDDPDQNHVISFAFCSPKDTFLKARGREIAEGRLRKKYITITQSGKLYEIAESAVKAAVEQKIAPSWARRGIQKGTFQIGLGNQS